MFDMKNIWAEARRSTAKKELVYLSSQESS